MQFFLSCSWTSSWFFISFSLCQITTSHCFETEKFILQFIEKINEFSSQLIIFLSFYECCLMSSFYDDDNDENNIIHLYSKKNSILHQYAEEHSYVWSYNVTSILTLINIKQKLIDSDLWISETSEFILSSCSQCWDTFTQLIKIINKDDKTVKTVMNIIDNVKDVKRTEKKIYFKHQKKLTKTAEFQVRLLNNEMLQDWLQTYWIN